MSTEQRQPRTAPAVRSYEELSRSYERYESARGELNREFVDPLETYREKYGGGACHEPDHEAIERPATLALAGLGPDGAAEGYVAELGEGDAAVVDAAGTEFRVKAFGQRREADAPGPLEPGAVVGLSVDVWDDDARRWREIASHLETSDAVEREYADRAVRVVLADAPRFGSEPELEALVECGLSPAEALDFWMVERRGRTQTEWATVRDASQQAISRNVRSARRSLD